MSTAVENVVEVSHVNNTYTDSGLGIFSKQTKRQVLHDVCLTIRKDEFFGLVGESGCGKSTLANAILGLIPYEGSIRVMGRERSELDRFSFSSAVQAVFQDPASALNPRKTIGFTMREPLRAHKIGTRAEQDAAVGSMLKKVGLNETYAARYPGELSGGQKQRVCIGASLMLEPELIIADEAISALDVSVGAQILNLFQEIDTEKDFSMLFISHNLDVVYYLCDRIAVMYCGHIVEMGTAEDVCQKTTHPYTKMLMAAVPGFGPPTTKTIAETAEPLREEVPGSCPFYARCRKATDACRSCPELINIAEPGEEEHLVRCVLAEKKAEEQQTAAQKQEAALSSQEEKA